MESKFFIPFVGSKYQEGINGKKILVVGASFYCTQTSCRFFFKCTNVQTKDSSPYDDICPVYAKDKMQLHNEPTYCVENAPRTYRIFASYISSLLESNNYDDTWNHLAFTNYVQFFLPGDKKGFRETRMTDLSERDFNAFLELLMDLKPDIVVIWGSVISFRLKEDNQYVIDKEFLEESEYYLCHIRLPNSVHDIALLNPYHPSSRSWFDNLDKFDKYFKMELNKS